MNENLQKDKLLEVISHSAFAKLDSALRAGKHIGSEMLELYALLVEYQSVLEQFYSSYHVELIQAPENFFYLRAKATSLISRSTMSEYDMILGKTLCYLYLSPERLAQNGVFHFDEILTELLSLCDQKLLLKLINPRSQGTDLDLEKVKEKFKVSVNKLVKIGMLTRIGERYSNKFVINESIFRFATDVRGEDSQQLKQKLFAQGEAQLTHHKEQESFDE